MSQGWPQRCTGTITLGDLDYANTVTTEVLSVAKSGTGNNAAMTLSNSDLLALMTLTNASLTNTEVSKAMTWTFKTFGILRKICLFWMKYPLATRLSVMHFT